MRKLLVILNAMLNDKSHWYSPALTSPTATLSLPPGRGCSHGCLSLPTDTGMDCIVGHGTRHRRRSTGFGFFGSLTAALVCLGCSMYTRRFSSSAYQPRPISKPPYTASAGSNSTVASWYGPGFNGNRTSNGEIFNQHQLTAASHTLPLGTYPRVTNIKRKIGDRVGERSGDVRARTRD
jgi:hypothetical protein